MPRILPLLGLMTLCACSGTTIGPSEPTPTSNPCKLLPLPVISDATRDDVADEMTVERGEAWPALLVDYLRLRAAVTACRGQG